MRIVALSYAYPPLRYPRSIQVARLVAHLPDGDSVHVVAADEASATDASLARAYGDAAPVTRVPWPPAATLAAKVRNKTLDDRLLVPDRNRPWVRAAVRAALPLLDGADALVTFGQPMSDHVAGLRLARRAGCAWVAHFSDPWVDSAFRRTGGLTRRLNERLERAVIDRADAVVFTSGETVDLVMGKYPAAWRAKAHVVPHAYDAELYGDTPARRDGDESVLRYIGNFYGHRGPDPLFRALAALRERDPGALDRLRVELVGSREHPVAVPDGLPVTLRDPVDYTESLALMRASDALLVVDAPAERSVFLPSKLVDYLGAGRPIVALTPPGAAADLVDRAGGWVADPADPVAGADALAAALRGAAAPSSDADAVRAAHAAPVVARRMRDIIAGAARR